MTTAVKALREVGCDEPSVERRTGHISVPVQNGASVLVDAVRRLDRAKVKIDDLSLRRPSLDDVFFALTGKPAEADGEEGDDQVAGDGERRRERSRA